MAKNNGKFTLFFMLFVMVLALCMVVGMDTREHNLKNVSFSAYGHLVTTFNNNSDKTIACSDKNQKDTDNLLQTDKKVSTPKGEIEFLCLMYHNIVSNNQKQGDYEVRVSTVEKDFIELKKLGYQCVGRAQLADIVANQKKGKYVMITFDDGFYGVYKYIPALLEKYKMKCVVSVVGEFMDMEDKKDFKTRCSYMNTKEVATLAKNPRVEIAHHSYEWHHINKNRRGVKIKKDEDFSSYQKLFVSDTNKLSRKLKNIGVKVKSYCYPYGEYCKESEKLLKDMGYTMTMTCNEKINYFSNKKTLYLIGRVNRSAKYADLSSLIARFK